MTYPNIFQKHLRQRVAGCNPTPLRKLDLDCIIIYLRPAWNSPISWDTKKWTCISLFYKDRSYQVNQENNKPEHHQCDVYSSLLLLISKEENVESVYGECLIATWLVVPWWRAHKVRTYQWPEGRKPSLLGKCPMCWTYQIAPPTLPTFLVIPLINGIGISLAHPPKITHLG